MNGIVFIDIDGVLIPNSMYTFDQDASLNRTMSNAAIGILNWLCKKCEVKVVTNSTHNSFTSLEGENLRQSLIRNGLKEKYLHDNWHTTYSISCDSRSKAIEYWLMKNHLEDIKWVCFDDMSFTKNHNLILVDPDDGLLIRHSKLASAKFGVNSKLFIF